MPASRSLSRIHAPPGAGFLHGQLSGGDHAKQAHPGRHPRAAARRRRPACLRGRWVGPRRRRRRCARPGVDPKTRRRGRSRPRCPRSQRRRPVRALRRRAAQRPAGRRGGLELECDTALFRPGADPASEPAALTDQCVATLSLPPGQITGQGLVDRTGPVPLTLAITGGTAPTAPPTASGRRRDRTHRETSGSRSGLSSRTIERNQGVAPGRAPPLRTPAALTPTAQREGPARRPPRRPPRPDDVPDRCRRARQPAKVNT